MSPRHTTLLALLLGAGLAAQNQPEGIQIYPGLSNDGTSFITRLAFNSAAGEALTEYPSSHFEGIGDRSIAGGQNNPTCAIAEVVLFYQDQDRTTQHNFGMVMRPLAGSGSGPDNNNQNAIFQFSNIQSPPNPGGTGPVGWWNSFQFVNNQNQPTPVALPSCKQSFFFGMQLNANAKWVPSNPTDGLSVYTAYYDPAGGQATSGDNVAPRKNVPNLTWQISGTNNAVVQPTTGQVIDYVLISPHSMLQVGVRHKKGQSKHSKDDGFGVAALYPIIDGGAQGRQDGLLVRLTDNRHANTGGQYGLYISLSTGTAFKIPPIQLTGITGSIYLGPVGQFFLLSGNLSSSSAHTQVLLAPPGAIPTSALGLKVYFQAWMKGANSSAVDITNMAGVNY